MEVIIIVVGAYFLLNYKTEDKPVELKKSINNDCELKGIQSFFQNNISDSYSCECKYRQT